MPVVDRELGSGEAAVWVGQPIPRQLARMALPQMLFGIPWTAFAIFWTTMASSGVRKGDHSAGSWLFALWGLPFILIGFVMLAAPLSALRRARRTAYVLTNRRAVIISLGWRGKMTVNSLEPDAFKEMRRNERADGTGDLIFREVVQTGGKGRNQSTNIGFLAIEDVKDVEERVRRLVREKSGAEN